MWEKMYGDCQVMSSTMGGSGISSESLFASPIRNPNFDFLSNLPFSAFASKEDSGLMRSGKEEMESGGSGSEHLEDKSINELDQAEGGGGDQQPPLKKKRYHRHTARQIQEMEALFKECPHPDDKQRMRLSQELGLKPRQVKFWFQNRRTQMKAQQDRSENATLRAENDNLKNENYRLQAALRSIVCPNCGGPGVLGEMGFDEQLRIENARLKDELERVCCMASRYSTGQGLHPMQTPSSLLQPSLDLDMNIFPRHFDPTMITPYPDIMSVPMMSDCTQTQLPEATLIVTDDEKSHAMELAGSSMEELIKLCRATEPLWIKNNENGSELLNFKEYSRLFPYNNGYSKGDSDEFESEASRDSAVVIMNSITLVDAFLDANKWMELFPSIVSRAKNIQVLAMGIGGNASGSLHLMYAEFQVVSPLVPVRETYFLRYCQQNADEGTWAIVDFPIDNIFHDNLSTNFPRYRRKPSGCLIQDMPNGYSRVTWLVHGEIEDKSVHPVFSHFVNNGSAFGAQRWLAVLQRQCERVASLLARNISDLGVIPSPEARRNLMRLSQRMIRTFSANMSGSGGQSWTAVVDSFDDTVRITTRKVTEPGQPHGVILAATSTTWLPYPHYQVFELLKDERQRSQLDMLSNGNALHEVAHIANGSHPGNCISLLRINVASNSSQHVELMLQESCTDQSGSLVIYTTVDVESIQLAMNGEDPSSIPLLPIGFSIIPAALNSPDSGHLPPQEASGCLLTVGLQVLASPIPNAKLNISSATAITNHLGNMVHLISTALCTGTVVSAGADCHDSSGGAAIAPPSTEAPVVSSPKI